MAGSHVEATKPFRAWIGEVLNKIVMTAWPPPGMKMGAAWAYDLRWVEQMAALANGACLPENKIGHVDVKHPRMAQLSRGRR